ncbi:PREDICTED: ubiquitin-associated domain-containing protein 1 [Dinoponera quadriceps]|uniref:Ubiquitin-associated domain-containing protein 1 n=1 Tax=Dinoponera quadriceps TaxID=609295 RepID=A0A6P3XTE1_DINQU|nr:PREDICTED: ubiquitin-associated domain-containing protein 1 [Dinoponera quadriceps]
MIPWMRDQIAEAWHNRKSSRTADRRSLALSSISAGNPASNDTMLMPLPTSPESFSVNVISIEGNILGVTVKPDFTVENIKKIAMIHFYGQDTTKPISRYRLVNSSKFKQLVDEHYVDDEDITEYDELLLVEIRPTIVQENLSDEALQGPNLEAIDRATCNLPSRNISKRMPPTECTANFPNEIRKILITLVQASAKILLYSADAGKLYDIIKEKLEARCKPINDPKVVKTLVEMGYPHKKVLKALRLRKSNMTEALEWLIEQDDSDEEEDEEMDLPMGTTVDASGAGPSTSMNTKKKSLKEACIELFEEENQDQTEKNLVYIVDLLLESFRQYKRMEFKPNKRVYQSLVEMGFKEKDIIGALKITGNDQSNACEWLLGGRRRSLQDLDEGMEIDGPIYKAIMNNPHIQLSLTNPKMLLAYISMIESPTSTNVWINDPEVSPVLSQISRTYHAEKHAIHMNRYA